MAVFELYTRKTTATLPYNIVTDICWLNRAKSVETSFEFNDKNIIYVIVLCFQILNARLKA